MNLSQVEIGQSVSITRTVSESDVYLFAGLTGDLSPNHIDEEYMKGGRYGHRIVHGALLVGLMSAVGVKMYLGRAVSYGFDHVRFTAPVFFGDTITVTYTVERKDEAKRKLYAQVVCTNQRGEVVAVSTAIKMFVD